MDFKACGSKGSNHFCRKGKYSALENTLHSNGDVPQVSLNGNSERFLVCAGASARTQNPCSDFVAANCSWHSESSESSNELSCIYCFVLLIVCCLFS